MLVDQRSKTPALAFDDSLELHLLPQYLSEPLLRSMRRNIFDLGVAGHHSEGVALRDRRTPWGKEVLTKRALREFDGAAFQTAHRLTLSRKIRHYRGNFVRCIDAGTLRSIHDRLGDARIQIRILSVGFFIASHPRIAVDL